MDLAYETDPQRKLEMERKARQWIGCLTPNRQYPYVGYVFLLVGILMMIALLLIPFDDEFVWDIWALPAILVVTFFMTVFFMCSSFYSTDIKINRDGLRIKRWGIGPEQSFDWSNIEAYEAGRLNNVLRMSDRTRVRVPTSGNFADTLCTAFSSFEFRFLLDDESDES